MRPLRRLQYPIRLAGRRLAARRGRIALVGLGIAAGAAVLAGVLAASLAARDRTLARATAALPSGDRAVRATWLGIPAQDTRGGWPELDRLARGALAPLGTGVVPALVYRETQIEGRLVDLAAVADVGRWVKLSSGRLPGACTPSRCEVVQVGGSGRLPDVRGVRLVRVGRGTLVSELPLGGFLSPRAAGSVFASAESYHTAPQPPFVFAGDVGGLASLPALHDIYRSYSWALPLAAGAVHPWSVGDFSAAVTRARSSLTDTSPLFDVSAPVDRLDEAASASEVGGRRLLLIGGEAAVLLLAFTILAAGSLRRDVEGARRRLTWFGATRGQLLAATAAEAGAVAAVAALLGWAAGIGLGTLLARHLGAPPWPVLVHSVLSATGIGLALALALVAATALVAALLVRTVRLGGRSLTALDAAAIGALAVIVIGLARGAANVSSLAAEGGTGTFLLLLPGLVAFVVAVACARALGPGLRALERAGRDGPVPLRLAALSLARNPGHAAVAVAFLVVSLGLALFAAAYRGTLDRGQSDQAAFAVPLDAAVREDLTKLVPVAVAAPQLAHYRPAGPETVPVLRLSGDLRDGGGFTLLGLPAQALPGLDGWRSDFSSASPAELARRLGPPHATTLRGVRLPAGARELPLRASVRGDDLAIEGTVQARNGTFVKIGFGRTRGAHPIALRAKVPPAARGGTLVGLSFSLTDTGLHGVPNGGANVAPVATGELTLGPLLGRGYEGWIGVAGVTPETSGQTGARLRYTVASELVSRFRARQATDGRAVPVAVTPALAAAAGPDGTLPLEITGEPLRARVVAVVRRFPTVSGDAVVADLGTAATALNAAVPGSATVDEAWLGGIDPQRLRQPPFGAFDVTTRRALETELRSQPLARGTLAALAAAATAALLLALAGLALGLVSDLRDERGELFDLEAQGAAPPLLRRHLRLRTLGIAGLGLLGGLATGALLTALVVDLVRVTAGATAPEPPLLLAIPWAAVLVGLAIFAALAALLAVAATRSAFREATQ